MNQSTLLARKFVTPAALSIAERIKSVCDGENLFDINGAIGIIRHEMEEKSVFKNEDAQQVPPEISEFVDEFRQMLVKRYNWSVNDAYRYSHIPIAECFKEGLSKHEAYFKIFNVEQDLQSSDHLV